MLISPSTNSGVMWDFPIVCCEYYHWLIKKLLWSMAGQNIARWEIQAEMEEERRQSQGEAMWLLKEKDARTLPVSHNFVETHRLIEMG